MKKLAEAESKDFYTSGFETACKKAGVNPKDVFVKSAQGGFFGTLGRMVAKPVASVAKRMGASQFGNDLASLNTLRGEAAGRLGRRNFLQEAGLGGVSQGSRGGKLKLIKLGPNDYKAQYRMPGAKVRSVDITHDALPSDIRKHFLTGRKSGIFDVDKGKLSGLQDTVGAFDKDPLYNTVGKYTAGAGAGAGALAGLGYMASGESETPAAKGGQGYGYVR